MGQSNNLGVSCRVLLDSFWILSLIVKIILVFHCANILKQKVAMIVIHPSYFLVIMHYMPGFWTILPLFSADSLSDWFGIIGKHSFS